jgi:hypothetical protein
MSLFVDPRRRTSSKTKKTLNPLNRIRRQRLTLVVGRLRAAPGLVSLDKFALVLISLWPKRLELLQTASAIAQQLCVACGTATQTTRTTAPRRRSALKKFNRKEMQKMSRKIPFVQRCQKRE